MKILILDALSTVHVGNGVLLDNSIKKCLELFPESQITIMSNDKKTNDLRYQNVFDDVFYDFPKTKIKKIIWTLRFAVFISAQLVVNKLFKRNFLIFCFNDAQRNLMLQIDRADICLSISGEIINDHYYARLYMRLAVFWVAIIKKKKVVIFPQSIGPIYRKVSKLYLRMVLKNAEIISARDSASLEVAKEIWGGASARVIYAPDIGVYQQSKPSDEIKKYFDNDKPVIGVTLSKVPREIVCEIDYIKEIVEAVKAALNPSEYNVLFMPSNYMLSGESDDYILCSNARTLFLGAGYNCAILKNNLIFQDEFQAIQKSLKLFITTRMHVGILATSAAVPTIMVNSQHKILGYMENIKSEDMVVQYQELRRALYKKMIFSLEEKSNQALREKLLCENADMKAQYRDFDAALSEVAGDR